MKDGGVRGLVLCVVHDNFKFDELPNLIHVVQACVHREVVADEFEDAAMLADDRGWTIAKRLK